MRGKAGHLTVTFAGQEMGHNIHIYFRLRQWLREPLSVLGGIGTRNSLASPQLVLVVATVAAVLVEISGYLLCSPFHDVFLVVERAGGV
jgi:hypothetical protein